MISQDDEKELLLQILQGSEPAFEKIYRLYSARLYGNLLKLIKSEPEAKEILQDVFLKVWNNRHRIDVTQSFRSYLFKIAENKVYDFFRKAAADKKKMNALMTAMQTGSDAGDESFLKEDNAILLQKAIAALPPQRQLIFRLCKLERKSYQEVSQMMGISVSTISDHIVKATRSIRQYFSEHERLILAFLTLACYGA